jgi:hypothetical protein
MKTAMTIVLTLVLVAASGCNSSPRGGSVLKGEGFKIAVPTLDTKLKQGEVQSVTVSLERGDYFKQDVKLQIEASKGISVEPTSVVIKASVKGIPKTGESTSATFTVKIVSP